VTGQQHADAPSAPRSEEALSQAVEELSQVLHAHAGGLELVDVDAEGGVTVRFTGMCTGCPVRPVTLVGLIKPALLELDGVEAVSAEGGRMSSHAEARLAQHLQMCGGSRLRGALSRHPREAEGCHGSQ
jgi:Fe-S cluster biogenesis protein NfuA